MFITCDGAGACYGADNTVNKLAAGAMALTVIGNTTNGLATARPTGINAGNASNVVFDDQDNGFGIAKPDVGAVNGYTVMKLPAGATTWTRVLDLPANVFDPCRALAYDHHGHLVAQCGTTLLRTRP